MGSKREVYSHGHHDSVLRSHRWRTAANSAGYLLPHLRPTDQVLDVGVGPGTITVELAAAVPDGSVVGLDNAPDAVAATRALAEQRGATNLTVAEGDVYAVAEPDGRFDVVHAHQVLQHLADPVAALREMGRVCRPGGLVAARDADYAAMCWYPGDTALDRWLDLYHRLGRVNGGEPDAGRRLGAWARAAGFGTVQTSASVWCFSTPEDVGWWSASWADRVTQSAFAEQAVARGLSEPAELAGLADAWRRWARSPDAWFTVLSGEVLARP